MKKRLFSLVLSLALVLFFAGTSSFAQNKTEKKDMKTDKKIEQTTNQKEVKTTLDNKTTEPNKNNIAVTKDRHDKMITRKHDKKYATTTKQTGKEEKILLKKEETNKKIK